MTERWRAALLPGFDLRRGGKINFQPGEPKMGAAPVPVNGCED
jgi:hypothetical protein